MLNLSCRQVNTGFMYKAQAHLKIDQTASEMVKMMKNDKFAIFLKI